MLPHCRRERPAPRQTLPRRRIQGIGQALNLLLARKGNQNQNREQNQDHQDRNPNRSCPGTALAPNLGQGPNRHNGPTRHDLHPHDNHDL